MLVKIKLSQFFLAAKVKLRKRAPQIFSLKGKKLNSTQI